MTILASNAVQVTFTGYTNNSSITGASPQWNITDDTTYATVVSHASVHANYPFSAARGPVQTVLPATPIETLQVGSLVVTMRAKSNVSSPNRGLNLSVRNAHYEGWVFPTTATTQTITLPVNYGRAVDLAESLESGATLLVECNYPTFASLENMVEQSYTIYGVTVEYVTLPDVDAPEPLRYTAPHTFDWTDATGIDNPNITLDGTTFYSSQSTDLMWTDLVLDPESTYTFEADFPAWEAGVSEGVPGFALWGQVDDGGVLEDIMNRSNWDELGEVIGDYTPGYPAQTLSLTIGPGLFYWQDGAPDEHRMLLEPQWAVQILEFRMTVGTTVGDIVVAEEEVVVSTENMRLSALEEPSAPTLELVSGRPVYRYYIAYTISGDLALELNFTGVTWGRKIRNAGEFSGTLTFDSDDEGFVGVRSADDRLREAYGGLMPGKMSLYVTRNNVPVWGGIISGRSYSVVDRTLTVNATGFESYLYRRVIWHSLTYPNTMDQYAVVRNLIAAMQTDFFGIRVATDIATSHRESGNIGIDVSQAMSGKHQDRQDWSGSALQNFGEVLEAFSDNLNGFEYTIQVGWNTTTDKFVKTLVFRDTPPSQLPLGVVFTGERTGIENNYFEYPGNILDIAYEDTVDETATRYFVTGLQPESIGDTEQPIPRGVYENEAYFATLWPILEVIESSEHSGVSSQTTLNSYAKSYGQRAKPPAPTWTITVNGAINPQVGEYNPGDWCSLVVTDPFITQGIESSGQETKVFTKRIAEFSVTVPDTEQLPEIVSLTLIDEWNSETG